MSQIQIEPRTVVTMPKDWHVEIVCNADRGAVKMPPPSRVECSMLELGYRQYFNPLTVDAAIGRAFDAVESIAYDLDETDRLRVIGQIVDLARELGRGR